MTWLEDYRRDVGRYDRQAPLEAVLRNQGLWALLQYRLAHAVHESSLPRGVKQPLLAGFYAWRKFIEASTGISLPENSSLGPGLLLTHFGNIILNRWTVCGEDCTISQGVTIGGNDETGAPALGARVYVGPNAVLTKRITVGDDARIGACSYVAVDVPAGVTVGGVPAREIPSRSEPQPGLDDESPGNRHIAES